MGCGNHVAAALDQVPEVDLCTCEPKVEIKGKKYPPKA